MNLEFPIKAAFIALPLEQQAKWQFQVWQKELKPFQEFLSFQNPQMPHLTLQYWSEIMEIEYQQILTQAKKISSAMQNITLNVIGVDTFGSREGDRILFLSVAFSDELAKLKKSCPWVSGKEFKPHITFARVRHPQKFAVHKKKIMKALQDCTFYIPVDRLRLYAEIEGRSQAPIQDFIFGEI